MRRLRATASLRSLVRETHLSPAQFVLPLFVCPGEGVRREIGAMPGNYQLSIDELVKECAETARLDARDALIAATALENGLTLATYEITRFRPARLKTFDPRQYSAEGESDWREAARAGSHWFKHLFVRA